MNLNQKFMQEETEEETSKQGKDIPENLKIR